MTTPKAESEAGQLFIDQDGDVCITGRENNLIFCPATDDGDGVPDWTVLNPDVVQEIVRRWNDYPALLARAEAAERELSTMKTAGIIEVAVRNPSVMDYIKHWEGRTEKAEASIGAAWCEGRDAAMREVIETKGEARFMADPHGEQICERIIGCILGDTAPPPDAAAALQRAKDAAWNSAYLAGFNASSEGWNGEYPFAVKGANPEDNPFWADHRNTDRALRKEG